MTTWQTIRAALSLLDMQARRRLGFAMLAQTATALFDLIGIVLIGAIGIIGVTSVTSQPVHPRITAFLSALRLGSISSAKLIALIGGTAVLLLLAKNLVNPLLVGRVIRFLANQQVAVSARLIDGLLARPITFIQQRSSQETAAALGYALNAATITILSQTVIAVAESALLALIGLTLLISNPALALGTIAYFGLFVISVHGILGRRASHWEAERMAADIASIRTVQEAIGAYREITVSDRRSFYIDRLQLIRRQAANAAANQQLMGIVPKYASEAALVLGAFALAAVLFTTRSLGVAVGTLALFLAAATRVMPSLLRLQGAALAIRSAAGSAVRTFALAEDLGYDVGSQVPERGAHLDPQHPVSGFSPTVQLSDVTYIYPGTNTHAIAGISLAIETGDSVALVGRSGSGKSTLADLILGVLEPDSGTVSVGGVLPTEAISQWPGSIAYVPQEVMLSNDSVRSNVALGLPFEEYDDEQIWDALRRAHLADYVSNHPDGLDAAIGEHGLRLSGGQRQRLGLARALFTRPRLVVLDEATSSLDAETEHAIGQTIAELDEDVTTVIIAHRLSTIRHADIVVYLEDGAAKAIGTFDEVCATVPALKRQAELMGLSRG